MAHVKHVVDDASLCISCSQPKRKDRYFLFDVVGNRRPVTTLVEKLYSLSFANDVRNYGSFLCRCCKRKCERWDQLLNNAEKVRDSVLETTQQFRKSTPRKRLLQCTQRSKGSPSSCITPKGKRTKVNTPTLKAKTECSAPECDSVCTSHPMINTTNSPKQKETIHCEPSITAKRKLKLTSEDEGGRRQTFTFRSASVVKNLRPIIQCLCNGSVQRATRQLLTSNVGHIYKSSVKGLSAAIKSEAKQAKHICSVKGEVSINKADVLAEVKTKLPLLWTVLAEFLGKKSVLAENHLLMAVCILLHAKNRNNNKLQCMLSMAMYQSQLQKEGYDILQHLGVTMSYKTLLNRLSNVALGIDNEMKTWQQSLEKRDSVNVCDTNSVTIDHTYSLSEPRSIEGHSAQDDHSYALITCSLETDGELGYRFNIDNLDYDIKVRNMTSEHQNRSKHYVQLPLGIFDKNENKTNDIIEVMQYLQAFVPGARPDSELEEIDTREYITPNLRQIPLGGDQLTCERIRGAHMARLDGDTPEERIEGVFAMIEDFHEKMNFLQAAMDKLYTMASAREGGTLAQLRNLINRRNVVSTVSKDYHAVADFFDLVTDVHVLVAVTEELDMPDMNGNITSLPDDMHLYPTERKYSLLKNILGKVVDKYTMSETIHDLETNNYNTPPVDQDAVYNYATAVIKYGLLRRVSTMTTSAGDGDRCMRNWRYALLIYHSCHKTKYRLEAFLLQAATKALLSPRLSQQIIWNRFVNLSGREGKNLDGDYVMELLNRLAKKRIKTLGPNHSSKAVARIGKTLLYCNDIEKHLLKELKIAFQSGEHTKQNVTCDITVLYEELRNRCKVLNWTPGRMHAHFPDFNADIFSNIDGRELHRWIRTKKREYSGSKWAF